MGIRAASPITETFCWQKLKEFDAELYPQSGDISLLSNGIRIQMGVIWSPPLSRPSSVWYLTSTARLICRFPRMCPKRRRKPSSIPGRTSSTFIFGCYLMMFRPWDPLVKKLRNVEMIMSWFITLRHASYFDFYSTFYLSYNEIKQ